MSRNATLTISLEPGLAARVADKIASGEFPDESTLIAESLQSFLEGDEETERWLRDAVVPTLHRLGEKPGSTLSAEEALHALQNHMTARRKASGTP